MDKRARASFRGYLEQLGARRVARILSQRGWTLARRDFARSWLAEQKGPQANASDTAHAVKQAQRLAAIAVLVAAAALCVAIAALAGVLLR